MRTTKWDAVLCKLRSWPTAWLTRRWKRRKHKRRRTYKRKDVWTSKTQMKTRVRKLQAWLTRRDLHLEQTWLISHLRQALQWYAHAHRIYCTCACICALYASHAHGKAKTIKPFDNGTFGLPAQERWLSYKEFNTNLIIIKVILCKLLSIVVSDTDRSKNTNKVAGRRTDEQTNKQTNKQTIGRNFVERLLMATFVLTFCRQISKNCHSRLELHSQAFLPVAGVAKITTVILTTTATTTSTTDVIVFWVTHCIELLACKKACCFAFKIGLKQARLPITPRPHHGNSAITATTVRALNDSCNNNDKNKLLHRVPRGYSAVYQCP